MSRSVYFHPKFKAEFEELALAVRRELVATLNSLQEVGPMLGRPDVDTLKDSKFANMKELRFRADGGVWRVALHSTRWGPRSFWSQATSLEAVRRRSIGADREGRQEVPRTSGGN